MDHEELFKKCIEDNKYSEIVTIPHKLKDGSDIKVEIRVLNNQERRACKIRAKKTVADIYEMRVIDLPNIEDMVEFNEELTYEMLYASFYIPGTSIRFFTSAKVVGNFMDDWLTSAIQLYSQVCANSSVAESVLSDNVDDENGNRLIEQLKIGALEPANFLAQSSPLSQFHLMTILVKQLQNALKDNCSLSLQLEQLTKKTKAGKDSNKVGDLVQT